MTYTWTAYAGSGGMASLGMSMTMYGNLPVGTLPSTWNTASQSGAAAHNASLTTAAATSLVLGATLNSAAAATPDGTSSSGTITVDEKILDTANAGAYTAQSVVTTAASSTVTLGVSEAAAGGAALVEIPLSAAPTVTPYCLGNSNSTSGDTTSTSSGLPWSFPGISAGETINSGASMGTGQYFFVAISAMGSPTGGQVTMSMTDSYGLTWTELVSANTAGNGYAGVWMGQNPAGPLISLPSYTLARCLQFRNYQTSLRNPGGWGPIQWQLGMGSTMPGGLYLEPSGLIYGEAVTAGAATFTAQATDQLGNVQTTQPLTINVISTL